MTGMSSKVAALFSRSSRNSKSEEAKPKPSEELKGKKRSTSQVLDLSYLLGNGTSDIIDDITYENIATHVDNQHKRNVRKLENSHESDMRALTREVETLRKQQQETEHIYEKVIDSLTTKMIAQQEVHTEKEEEYKEELEAVQQQLKQTEGTLIEACENFKLGLEDMNQQLMLAQTSQQTADLRCQQKKFAMVRTISALEEELDEMHYQLEMSEKARQQQEERCKKLTTLTKALLAKRESLRRSTTDGLALYGSSKAESPSHASPTINANANMECFKDESQDGTSPTTVRGGLYMGGLDSPPSSPDSSFSRPSPYGPHSLSSSSPPSPPCTPTHAPSCTAL